MIPFVFESASYLTVHVSGPKTPTLFLDSDGKLFALRAFADPRMDQMWMERLMDAFTRFAGRVKLRAGTSMRGLALSFCMGLNHANGNNGGVRFIFAFS